MGNGTGPERKGREGEMSTSHPRTGDPSTPKTGVATTGRGAPGGTEPRSGRVTKGTQTKGDIPRAGTTTDRPLPNQNRAARSAVAEGSGE